MSDAPRYLAALMFPYRFEPVGLEHLAGRANAFIREMRKDTPFWEDIPLFKVDDVRAWDAPRSVSVEQFSAALQSVPLGSRAHFFDLASRQSWEVGAPRALDRATSYATRKRGLDTEESAARLVESGLVERSNDARGFLLGLTHKELTEVLGRERVDYRKSWKKERLVSSLVEQRPAVAQHLADQVVIGSVAAKYAEATAWAKEEIDRTSVFFQLWLGFGVDPGEK
jgi:hypothetical protein